MEDCLIEFSLGTRIIHLSGCFLMGSEYADISHESCNIQEPVARLIQILWLGSRQSFVDRPVYLRKKKLNSINLSTKCFKTVMTKFRKSRSKRLAHASVLENPVLEISYVWQKGCSYVVVSLSVSIYPQSPSILRDTLPLGRIVSQVILPLCRDILNHASGGSCNALNQKKLHHLMFEYIIMMAPTEGIM